MKKKTILITIGSVAAAAAVSITAASILHSSKLRSARALRRACDAMFLIGTAMRNLSGKTDCVAM